jgi:hypothetical protein
VATQALGGAEVVELLAPVASESTLSLSSPLVRDVLVFVLAGVGAKLWTKIFDILVRNGVLEQVWRFMIDDRYISAAPTLLEWCTYTPCCHSA